ncbi:hypothetical protein C8R44DRAFT_1934 [Mycena epipterygia]|nr:hypothetical protein C8R44DRAFT_1934 [Mycena epipterygia]
MSDFNSVPLSYDLLHLALDILRDETATLYRCTLVNWEVNRTASRILYSRVELSPEFRPTTNPKRDVFIGPGTLLSSACLPRNAPHVRILRVGGYLSSRPPMDLLPEALLAAVQVFENLHTVEILPEMHPNDLFPAILAQLQDRGSLVNLRVNSSCTDDETAPILAKIEGLRQLQLESPSRAILQLLPDWLGRLTSLRELHLTRNCGSVTPGVLRSFVPLLTNITAFSFGLSYSITDDDLFDFLGQLPCLETVQLQHYLQLKSSDSDKPMKRLRSLTVLHRPVEDPEDIDRLCAWVERAIFGSPIERIQLCCDEFDESYLAPRCFDALIEHLSRMNPGTLKTLDLGGWLVSDSAVSLLFETCVALEEFAAAVDIAGFESFTRLLPTMKFLHTVVLQVHQMFDVSAEDAARTMQSSSALRRLSVNDLRMEGTWVSQGDSVRFVVEDRGAPSSIKELPIITETRNPPSMDVIFEED